MKVSIWKWIEAGLKLLTPAIGRNHWPARKWTANRDSWPKALGRSGFGRGDHRPYPVPPTDALRAFNPVVFYKAREGVQKVDVSSPTMILVLADLAPGRGAICPTARMPVHLR